MAIANRSQRADHGTRERLGSCRAYHSTWRRMSRRKASAIKESVGSSTIATQSLARMALHLGSRATLTHYRIVALLCGGGMGYVDS
jgi:hypothetical protein